MIGGRQGATGGVNLKGVQGNVRMICHKQMVQSSARHLPVKIEAVFILDRIGMVCHHIRCDRCFGANIDQSLTQPQPRLLALRGLLAAIEITTGNHGHTEAMLQILYAIIESGGVGKTLCIIVRLIVFPPKVRRANAETNAACLFRQNCPSYRLGIGIVFSFKQEIAAINEIKTVAQIEDGGIIL